MRLNFLRIELSIFIFPTKKSSIFLSDEYLKENFFVFLSSSFFGRIRIDINLILRCNFYSGRCMVEEDSGGFTRSNEPADERRKKMNGDGKRNKLPYLDCSPLEISCFMTVSSVFNSS